MAPEDIRTKQEFVSFSTKIYKLSFFEVPTGIKFVLVTKDKDIEFTNYLRGMYKMVYIPYVSRNIFYKPGTEIKCSLFDKNLKKFFKSLEGHF